jgi:hypothetical protein
MWKSLVLLLLSPLLTCSRQVDRNLRILNESGGRVELYWVHPETRALSLMSTPFIYDGATFPLQTYVGHEFEVRELPSTKTGECGDETCKIGLFAISGNDDQRKFRPTHGMDRYRLARLARRRGSILAFTS